VELFHKADDDDTVMRLEYTAAEAFAGWIDELCVFRAVIQAAVVLPWWSAGDTVAIDSGNGIFRSCRQTLIQQHQLLLSLHVPETNWSPRQFHLPLVYYQITRRHQPGHGKTNRLADQSMTVCSFLVVVVKFKMRPWESVKNGIGCSCTETDFTPFQFFRIWLLQNV